eukprot:1459259-Rhodomonas_salina.2
MPAISPYPRYGYPPSPVSPVSQLVHPSYLPSPSIPFSCYISLAPRYLMLSVSPSLPLRGTAIVYAPTEAVRRALY